MFQPDFSSKVNRSPAPSSSLHTYDILGAQPKKKIYDKNELAHQYRARIDLDNSLTNSPTSKYQRSGDGSPGAGSYSPQKFPMARDEIILPGKEVYALARQEKYSHDSKLISERLKEYKPTYLNSPDFDYSKYEAPTNLKSSNRRSNIYEQDSLDHFKQQAQDKSPNLRNSNISTEMYSPKNDISPLPANNGFEQKSQRSSLKDLNQKMFSLPPQNPKNQLYYIPENSPKSVNIPNYSQQNQTWNRNQNQRYVLDPISQSPLLRNHADLKRPQLPDVFGRPNMKSEFAGLY